MPPEEATLRDSIADAFEKAEKPNEPSTPPESAGAGSPPPEPTPPEEPAEPPAELAAGGEPPAPVAATPPSVEPAASPQVTPFDRPPTSWKPAIRDAHWKKLPQEVREEVIRREREITRGLNEAADARKFHQRFMETIRPYEQMMRMESDDPMTTFNSYLKTAAILRQGTPQEKASNLANIIAQFQVDPALLDQALVGIMQGRPMTPPAQQRQEFRDPRVDQLLAQREQEIESRAVSALEAFENSGKAEFLDDVRDLMSDILSLAVSRGQEMDLQTAYDRAIMIHPEVSKILEARRASEAARKQSEAAQAARRKAVGGGSPPPPGEQTPTSTGTVRSDIEAAITKLEGGM